MTGPVERSADHDAAVQVGALVMLALSLVCEGFDLQIVNFAAADLIRDLGVPKAELAPLLSASLVGMLIGAPLVGRQGDIIGRRKVVIGGTIIYGLLSLLCCMVSDLWSLAALRLLIGISLGGVLPNIFALAGELAPAGLRARFAALIGVGLSLGGVLAGGTAALLATAHWRTLLALGGLLPLALSLLLWFYLPESRLFSAGADKRKLGPDPTHSKKPGIKAIFAGELALVTPAIWVVFACVLMTVYLVSSWSPVLLREAAMSAREAALVTTGYHVGAMAGSVAGAFMVSKGGWKQIAIFLFAAAVTLVVAGLSGEAVAMLAISLAATGFFVVGAQNSVNGATTDFYPSAIRATGLGWAFGIGRIGAILGPLTGGAAAYLGHGTARDIFLIQAAPLLIATGMAIWISRRLKGMSALERAGKA